MMRIYKACHSDILIFIVLIFAGQFLFAQQTYYVATDGSDGSGNGSNGNPWASIGHALAEVADGDMILVGAGTYYGQVELRGTFTEGVTVRSELPYQARLRNNGKVVSAKSNSAGCMGITLEGFDIAHDGPGAGALVIHIDGGGDADVQNITLRNNVLHDSYDNDVLKINHSSDQIIVEGNVFYNQHGEDEHIDINSATNITVQDNIFFNDFAGSGRPANNDNSTSSFIVIKDSNGESDIILGSHNITVRRNVFFNWEGCPEHSFVMVGEDGHSHFEAYDVTIENNLMLGNSPNLMRAALTIRGVRDVTFRHNTIAGNLPSQAYAMRLNLDEDNQLNENIFFYNNIWCDPGGTMGAENSTEPNDFSDTAPGETASYELKNNLYWNGGTEIPFDADELINYTNDVSSIEGDPLLGGQSNIPLPRWDEDALAFADGSQTIREAFENLVLDYGEISDGSSAIDAANAAYTPDDDILGNSRSTGGLPDLGAYEAGAVADIPQTNSSTAEAFILHQNYPNPFNPTTTLRYTLAHQAHITLTVFDVNGLQVRNLLDKASSAGTQTVQWDGRAENGSAVSSGIYFYRLQARPSIANGPLSSFTRQMLLLK